MKGLAPRPRISPPEPSTGPAIRDRYCLSRQMFAYRPHVEERSAHVNCLTASVRPYGIDKPLPRGGLASGGVIRTAARSDGPAPSTLTSSPGVGSALAQHG
jgi:hypothetical protein